jgi:hypothetical protein
MPTRTIIVALLILAAGCGDRRDVLNDGPTGPTRETAATRLTIQGPSSLEVGEQAQFTITFVDRQGVTREPALTTWTTSSPAVLPVDRFSGSGTAAKTGQALITVFAEQMQQSLQVTVLPKVAVAMDLDPVVNVGQLATAFLDFELDHGDRTEVVGLLGALVFFPGQRVQWQTTTPSIISVVGATGLVAAADIRGLLPGTGVVTASVLGFTVEGRIIVRGVIVPTTPDTPPTTPNPPPSTPNPPPAAPDLRQANAAWPIRSTASPDPCAGGFSFNYEGTVTISGVQTDGTGGSATLTRPGAPPITVPVTVRQDGSGFVIEFAGPLSLNSNSYDYRMRWQLDSLGSGAIFTGTQTLSGPCNSQSTVSGRKA